MNNKGKVMLSILIPSIPERKKLLNNLMNELKRQLSIIKYHESLGEIRILYNDGKSFLDGGLSIGKKREQLVMQSTGKYLCFLDDDETISPDYAETLLRLCNQDQDVCTFKAFSKLESCWGIINMSLKYKVNDQFSPEYEIRRPPWHICPVRADFARLYKFKDKNNAEDFEWFEKVLTHCTTESHTDKIIFQYNHGKHSEADKIENHV